MKYNEGILHQMKNKPIIKYENPRQITRRHLALMFIQVLGEWIAPYSKNKITTEEELDIEVTHFFFLSKYNLL